jgi:hypothetical protein
LFLQKSDSLEAGLGRCVNLRIELGNRLDVRVPSVLSSHLLNSFLLLRDRWLVVEPLSERLIASKRSVSSVTWRLSNTVPLHLRGSQEWNGISELRRFYDLIIDFILSRPPSTPPLSYWIEMSQTSIKSIIRS